MTTTQTEFEIHEFSTGIRWEKTADGGWVSLGFTGQYMNATIDPIPHPVLRSIANKEFAVAEGASSDEPAIIGRVVSGGEEPDWAVVAVVAVVTRGRDEKGRSASFYRYFLSKGAENLSNIMAWIEDQDRLGLTPVFNPFENKVLGQSSKNTISSHNHIPLSALLIFWYKWYQTIQNYQFVEAEKLDIGFESLAYHLIHRRVPLSFNDKAWLSSQSTPILVQPKSPFTPQKLDELATEKAKMNGQPVAWAYKVEALEQPGRFQIIKAASDKAYELLQRAKVSISQMATPMVDEQAIKSAIKGLISSSKVKLECLQAIAEPLGNDQILENYWKEIFDGQGATNALKQGIYSPQMVRLLTLRSIMIPQTLPEYLVWLSKENNQNKIYTISAEFQSQFKNYLSQIPVLAENTELKITEGIKLLLPKLLERKVSVEAVHELLKTPNGLWAKFYDRVVQDIEHDLQLMSQFANGSKDLPFNLKDSAWQGIRMDIKKYWQISSSSLSKKYQLFAELFAVSGYHNLSACFYAISLGYVPKEVFKQAFPNAKWQCYIYGRFLIYREVTPLERLGITLAQNALPIFIFLLVISLLTTLTILSKNILIPAMNSYFAFTDFKQSGYRSLQKMISNLQGTTGIKDQAIVHQVIKEVFKKSDLEFKASEKNLSDDVIHKWIKAILDFQKSNTLEQVDGKLSEQTRKKLNDLIAQKLLEIKSDEKAINNFYNTGSTYDAIQEIIEKIDRENRARSGKNFAINAQNIQEELIRLFDKNLPKEVIQVKPDSINNEFEQQIKNDEYKQKIKKWIVSIKKYQKDQVNVGRLEQKNVDGIINKEQQTSKLLEEDLRTILNTNKLLENTNKNP